MQSFETDADHVETRTSRLRFNLPEVVLVALVAILVTLLATVLYFRSTDSPTACEAYTALAMPLSQPSGQNSVPAINPILLADVLTPTAEYSGRAGELRWLFDRCAASVKPRH